MCEHCSCRRQPSIAQFGADHDRIEVVARRLDQAHACGDRVSVRTITAELLALLVPHVTREEQGLFPELAASGGEQHTRRMEREHDEFDAALVPVAAGVATDAQWEALPAVLEELRQHIWIEEFDVFPAALQLLDPFAWQRVERVCDDLELGPVSAETA
ncbi:MAG TPA: hemerythrin domain-containing protein [Egicoccus sp.]|nr:hemerythrin domain-containing protein [Egicoccus sp.]HSK23984.1 hemerythrin domain-containing protein [Egicoccus sp.]